MAAREIVRKYNNVYVLGIDRSAKATQMAIDSSQQEMKSGRLKFRTIAIEDFALKKGDSLFDMIFGIRVGALDGRHPEIEKRAFAKIKKALNKNGRCFIDGGNPLKELLLDR